MPQATVAYTTQAPAFDPFALGGIAEQDPRQRLGWCGESSMKVEFDSPQVVAAASAALSSIAAALHDRVAAADKAASGLEHAATKYRELADFLRDLGNKVAEGHVDPTKMADILNAARPPSGGIHKMDEYEIDVHRRVFAATPDQNQDR